jgi:hypothetical protein
MQHFDKTNTMKSHLLHHIKAGLLFVFAMVLTLTVSATVFNVNTTNDTHAVNPAAGTGLDASGNISFRSALEAANAVGGTHTVNLQALTYNLTLGEITIGDFTQNITINGISAASTIVNMTNTNRDRILFINSTGTNPNITTVINNVQFTNGQLNTDTYGGGAIIAGGPNNSLTLNSCIFSGNSIGATGTAATQGGAVRYNGGGSLTIDNCTFSNNSNSKSDGGAVSYFLENLAGAGNGAVTITNSTFNNNSVTANGGNGGGAIHVAAQGRITAGITFTVNILRNTFTSNSASGTSGVGGAIRTINSFDVGNTMMIQYNRFVNNTATLAPSALAMSSAQGNVNATDNWWGCNTGPSAAGTCDRAAITGSGGVGTLNTATWLQLKLTAATSPVCYTSGTSVVTASFLTNSAGTSIALANLVRVIGLPITFSATLGTLSGAQPNITAAGTATVTYTAGANGGTGTVNGVVDNVPAAETTPARASIVINKPVVTNPGVTTGTAGTAFSQTFTASGGSTPYTFSTSSTLPTGLTLSAAGVLSGTPTVVGTFPIVVNVTDNLSCTATGTTYNLVISCQTITVTNPGTTTGTVGTAFSQTFTQTSAIGGATFSVFSGTLPTGLTLSAAGVLSGTPTQSGTFPIVVRVTDGNNCTGNSPTYNLVISCQTITVTNPGVATGTNGTAFSQTFTQTGAIGGATFSVFSGTLPNGLTLSAAGVLSGTPSAPAGTYPIVVRATDGNGCFGNGATYNLVIGCQTITVTNPAVTTGQTGVPFSQTFTQAGGIGTTNFSLFSGSLPAGLTLSAAGVLGGTPTATGTFPIVVRATDANGCFGNGATYTLVITSCPIVDQTVTASPTSVCTGTGSTVTVAATQPGINYTLRIDPSNVVVSGPATGTGAALNFPTGNLSSNTTFNVLAETDSNSVYLNGGQSGFAIPQNAALDVTNNFTIEGWIKPDGDPDFGRLFNKDGSYALGVSSNQTQLTFTRHSAGDFSRPFTFVNGQWYHIACTYVSGTVELFVNGTSIGTVGGVPAINVTSSGGHIGSDAGGNFNQFRGNIDNVRIWNSVRTQAQIAANQLSFLTSTGNPTLVASWWISEGSGNAKDYSANAINSTGLAGVWQGVSPVPYCNLVLTNKPTVTVIPDNSITLTSAAGTDAQTVCINTPIVNITYSTVSATGATFSGLPAGVTGNWAANVVTISGTPTSSVGSPFSYTVTLTGGCGPTTTANGTITVTPNNTITLTSAAGTNAQTVCINTPITPITYSTTGATGATFSGLPAGVTGNWAANVVTISGTPTSTVGSPFSYTVTLTGGCGTITATGTITVNPIPTVNAVSNQVVCNGAPTAAVTFSGAVPGTVYNWTNNTTSIGLGASGSGNIASFNGINTGTAPVTATITVTPSYTNNGVTCTGTPTTFTITVNPPNTVAQVASQTVCNGSATTAINFSSTATGGTVVYNWTGTVGTIGLPTSGSGNIASFTAINTGTTVVSDTIKVTADYTNGGTTCTSPVMLFVITVNPTPTVNTVADQTVCTGTPTAAVNFSGAVTGTVYNWTNNTTSIGLGASGTGNIPSFTATNATAAPVTATVTVTPVFYNQTIQGSLVSGDLTMPSRLFRDGVPGSCPTKAFPGTSGGAHLYDTYTFVNTTGQNQCVTISYAAKSTGDVFVAAYNGSFNPAALSTNYMSDGGTSSIGGSVTTFSVNVNAGATLVLVALEANSAPCPNYVISVTGLGTSCTGTPRTFNITVNPTPTVNTVANQVVCNGAPTAAVNFTGATTGTVYNWTNNTTSIGLAASGSGNIASFNAINTGTAPVTATITVTPSYTNGGTTCTGTPTTFTITVNPTPTVNTVANQVVCNGAPTAAVNFSGAVAGTVYSWTNNTPSIGLAASGTGNIASFNAINTGTAPVTATITVTPSYTNGGTTCTGTPTTFTITVNPTPTVNAVANQVVCNGAPTTAVTFSGSVPGTVYNWTNNTPSIGLAASGTGNIASFNAINTGTAPVTATITVTPSYTNGGTTCTGTPTTFTITVNPTPTVNAVANQVVCNGAPTTAVNFSGAVPGTVYNWTNNTPSIGLAASGSGNIASFNAINAGTNPVTATITVTPSYTNGGTTCTGTSTTFTITVNPTPTVNAVANQVVCNGAPTTAVTFTGAVSGTVFNWTNNTTSIGLAASGTGNIASFNAINTGNAPVVATITVTPSYTNGGTTCTGTPRTFTITVNPTPVVNSVPNQVICNGAPTTAVNFSSPTTGGTIVYNWTNNTTSIGLAASGSGNIASFTATNATNAPVTATITVTASYTNGGTTCTSAPVTFTITVNPTPIVNNVSNQVVCNGEMTADVFFSSPTTGGTIVYNWTNNNTSIGLGASGTGNIPAFTATNATNAPVTATITVIASYTNGGTTCTSAPRTFTITVNPTPVVNSVPNQTVCNGAPTAAVNFSSPTTGGTIVYNWTNSTPSIGLAASGSGNIASFNAVNATNDPVTATITVIASYTNGGTTCSSAPVTFTITVNPTPVVNSVANQVVCNGAPTTAVTFTSPTTGGTIVYNWTNNTPSIGLAASGSGDIASFNAVNATNAPVTATITVTASYTNGGTTCTSAPVTFTITVNPTPTVNAVANQTVCNNSATAAVTFTGSVAGTVYNWTNNNTSIGLAASGTGNIASFTATNATNAPVTATITVTPSYTNGGTTCTGASRTFTITVNPTPNVNPVANQTVCNGSATPAINFNGTVAGTVYSWTNNTTSIGLAASGTGNIASFTAVNTGTTPVTATITVTPSYTNGSVTCTGTPITFTITVNPSTVITANPTSQTICAGGNVTFTGAATGLGLSYQWQVNTGSGFTNVTNGGVYSGATTATLTITGATAGMNGYQYRLEVTGTCGVQNTTAATLTVNTPPNITTHPANTAACVGANTSFTVVAAGTGLTYQWQLSTTGAGGPFTNITNGGVYGGATTATLTITGVTAAMNNYRYQVVISGTCPPTPVTSNQAVLTVNNPVVITQQPASITICFGGSPTFTVAATGTGITYQWQVNTGSGFVNIPGATSASYTVPNPTVLFSFYQYRAVVTGTCNTVISNTATLIVFGLPNINFAKVPPRVCLTDTIVTLKAEPAGGTWTGRGITGGDKFSATAAGTGVSTLTYTVVNANGCISIENYNITVNDCKERHQKLQDALRIYPNPSNGRFNIGFFSDNYKEFNLRVIDARGAVVRDMRFTGLVYGSVIPMDLTSLGSGMYILEAYNTQERASYRIVLTR